MNIKRTTFWLALLIIFVLALPGGSAVTHAQAGAQTTIQAVPIFEELLSSSSSTLSSAGGFKDFGGNAFDSWLRLAGNDTRVVIQKRDRTGRVVAQTDVVGSGGRKIRDAALYLDGDDVEIRLTDYELTPGTRINAYERAVWPDVAIAYPNGLDPRSGAGESIYAQGESTLEVDYDRIKRDVAGEVMAQLRSEFRGGELRQILEDKNKDAIGESFDRALYNTDLRARYAQDATLPWFRDRAYQGATSALANVGVCRAP